MLLFLLDDDLNARRNNIKTGEPGEKSQNRESPSKTERVNNSVFLVKSIGSP